MELLKEREMFQKKIKRNFIAVNRIRVVCPQAQLYASWCSGCRADVEMVTFAEAASIACTSVDSIIEQAAKGKVHLGIRPEAMLVCLNSLLCINEFLLSTNAEMHLSINSKKGFYE
jgi:hypothetical protein